MCTENCYAYNFKFMNHCSALTKVDVCGITCPFYKAKSVREKELKEMQKRNNYPSENYHY